MTPHVSVGALEDRFAQFMRLHHTVMRRYFVSVGMFNGHPHMLFHIRRQAGITQKELADHMEISPASVATSVRRLETAGLVERRRDERDGRVMHLFLTAAGEQMDTACAHGRDFMMETLYEGLTAEEKDTLYGLLAKMTANLQTASQMLPEIPKEE